MISDEELEHVSGGTGTQYFFRHCVVRGETLARLASKYKTTPQEIMMLNPIIKDDNIYVGWELIIPDNR